MRSIYSRLPFAPNLSTPEYVPTWLLSLLCTLRTHFPRHRLLLSDFSSLPDAVPGVNAPVVQARVSGTAVACSTLFVQPGLFEIFFLTHFGYLRDMYEHVLAQPLTVSDDDRLPLAPSPLATSSSPLSAGAGVLPAAFTSRRICAHPLMASLASVGYPSASASRTCSRLPNL